MGIKRIAIVFLVMLLWAGAGCLHREVAPLPEAGVSSGQVSGASGSDTSPELPAGGSQERPSGEAKGGNSGERVSEEASGDSALSTRELLDEARMLACSGAQAYKKGDTAGALASMQAALLNLQLADLPEDMQTINFFQPYLPAACKDVDLSAVYADLVKREASEEDIPPADNARIPDSEQSFIHNEILRILENLGEDAPKPEEMEVFSREVERFIRYFQNSKREWFQRSYLRMLKYEDTVESIFAEKHLPSELKYLAFVESGYLYRAFSRAKARGIWQFMRKTGRIYGLRIGRHIDERLDPVKSTIAAREYLLDLISIFGSRSFLLAMASYNAGEGRVQKCLRKIDNPFENRSFWQIRDCLRRETQEYIPRMIAVAIICENLDHFDFDLPDRSELKQKNDLVVIPKRVRLSSIAKAAGITVSQLRELNPDLPSGGWWTPVNNTHLWLPKNTSKAVKVALKKMKSLPAPSGGGYSSGEYHRVRRGESLYKIGQRYKIPYKKLAKWNHISYPYRIKPGQKIYLHPPGKKSSASPAASYSKSRCEDTLVYIVQKGNFLAGIGSIFGTTARSIMSLNGLSRGVIYPGQRLTICPGFPVDIIQHVVKKNETLYRIARKHGVSIEHIRFVNGIKKNGRLRVGQKLTIYRRAKS